MYTFGNIIFLILPTLVLSFSCRYNESRTIERKAILLDLDDHNYIRIYDAWYDIVMKNESVGIELTPGENLRLIENIQFKGYLVQGGVSNYVEKTLTDLVGFRFRRHGDICRLSYQETKINASKWKSEQENAILRLAQSCIQSKICGINLMQIDKHSDLYYQSIQSNANDILDFYIPKVLDLILDSDKNFKLPTIDVKTKSFKFFAKTGLINGIYTVQRISDFLIKSINSKYIIEFNLRFPKLKLTLNGLSAQFRKIHINGNSIVNIEGASFRAILVLDLQENWCSIDLANVGKLAFKNITVDVGLWKFHPISYNINSRRIGKVKRKILDFILANIPQYSLDCTQYLDKLAELIHE